MKCPICEKPAPWQDNPNRPFCSERCKLIDFGKWVDEDYRVPTEEAESGEDLPEEASPQSSERTRWRVGLKAAPNAETG